MDGPQLKILSETLPSRGLDGIKTSGLLPISTAISTGIETFPMKPEDLEQFLHNRLAIARTAAKRKSWFGGRWFNAIASEDPDYIQMSGARLREILPLAGFQVPDFVSLAEEYALRRDIVEAAHALLQQELNGA